MKIYTNNKSTDSEFFNVFTNLNFNFYSPILLKLQKIFIKKLININHEKITFFSDKKAYFIEILKQKIQNKKNLNLYYSNSRSYPRILQIICKQFLKSFFTS